MRRTIALVVLGLALVAAGCDVFLPSSGYFDQPCRSDGTCAVGLRCQNDVCVRIARIWYVHPDPVAADEDAESWMTAAVHPQDAMDRAVDGDQIWVAAGSYGRRSPNDTVLLEMKPGVRVLGGFTGGETDAAQRDPVNHRPILDCSDHCSQVIVGATRATLDGFVVRGGAALGAESPSEGAGFYAQDVGGLVLADCTFTANAGFYGAGVTIERPVGPIEIRDCLFTSNVASRRGGGLYLGDCQEGSASLERVDFHANRAEDSGGALFVDSGCRASLSNALVWDNTATDGGGVYAAGSLQAVNSTFADNEASSTGGALYVSDGTSVLVNSIFFSDTAVEGGREIYLDSVDASIISYSLVHGGLAGGTQIIDSDPRFVSQQGGNFRLQAGSPCIDAGTNDHPEVTIPFSDFDGRARPRNLIVDMGAFEY